MRQWPPFLPFLLLLPLSMLVGCIEVKDKNQKPAEPSPVVRNASTAGTASDPIEKRSDVFSSLTVDQPLYLYRGQVVKAGELTEAEEREASFDRSEYNFDEINILPGGVLYTLGASVKINVNRINSDWGVIATYPEGVEAAKESEGRSGGQLIIRTQYATGTLEIILRGEKGGEGRQGPEPDKALKGKPGADFKRSDCYSASTSIVPLMEPEHFGSPGFAGKEGYPGERGFKGGDSGSLDFEIAHDSEAILKVSKIPGAGGEGGRGGDGGEGGNNGQSCMGARLNEPTQVTGAQGPEGPEGPRGPEGNKELACYPVNNHHQCFPL